MSATNFTPIQLYRTSTAAAAPTAGNLAAGELAINLTDEKLYFKNAAGVVKLLASNSGSLGSVTSVDVSGGTTGLTTSGGPITSSGTITLAGTLGVANGGTGTGTAFTAGSVVFAGASGVYSQDNANFFWDDTNNRLGIGTATPSANLTIGGVGGAPAGSNIDLTGYNSFAHALMLSSAGSSAVDFIVGTSSAIPLILNTNSAERMRITSAGNVGIGVTSPSAKLDVDGSIIARTGGSVLTDSVAEYSGGGINLTVGTTGARDLVFRTNNTEKARIDTNGNFGLGTATPTTYAVGSDRTLAIAGSSFASLNLVCGGSFSGAGLTVDSSANLQFRNVGVERMRIDNSGNLMVGTTTADNRLTVSVSSTGAAASVASLVNPNDGAGTAADLDFVTHSSGTLATGRIRGVAVGADDYALAFSSYGSGGIAERMRITGPGNVGIGTTAPQNYTNLRSVGISGSQGAVIDFSASAVGVGTNRVAQLYGGNGGFLVFSTGAGDSISEAMRITSAGALLIGTTTTLAAGFKQHIQLDSGQGGTIYRNSIDGSYALQFLNAAGSTSGWVQVNASSTTYNSISDVRLKHDIVDAPEASSLIDAIQVRSFKWNADNSEQRYGFVAQELVAVAPEAVSQPADPDDMMGVDYSKLVPMLVKEIQSLRARVAQLEGK